MRLLPCPPAIVTLLGIFDTVEQASETVSAIIAAGMIPAAMEMMDRLTLQAAEAGLQCGYPPDAGAVLLLEVDGMPEMVEAQAAIARAQCSRARRARGAHGARRQRARTALEGPQGRDRLARPDRAELLHPRWRRAAFEAASRSWRV